MCAIETVLFIYLFTYLLTYLQRCLCIQSVCLWAGRLKQKVLVSVKLGVLVLVGTVK